MKNIQKFTTAADYSAATHAYPNVSWITSGDTLIFNAEDPTPSSPIPSLDGYDIAVEYSVADASQEVQLYSNEYRTFSVTGMSVDGESVTPSNTYRFSTSGNHIVRFKTSDTDLEGTFSGLTSVINANVGVNIGGDGNMSRGVFMYCSNLLNVKFAPFSTNFDSWSYSMVYECTSLESITFLETTPFMTVPDSFDMTNDCPIYVPSESVNAYKADSVWSTYASRIEAIPS